MIKRLKYIVISLNILMLIGLTGCGKSSTDAKLAQGMDDIISQEYDAALVLFNEAYSEGADAEQVYRGIGLAYMGKEEYGKAITAFKTALEAAGMFSTAKLITTMFVIHRFVFLKYEHEWNRYIIIETGSSI